MRKRADLPCSFTGPLCYLLTTREEAVESYKAMIDEHVTQEFRDSTLIKDFLCGEKATQCFVPEKWEGMKGVRASESSPFYRVYRQLASQEPDL
jgi:hypothetical protein